MLNKLLILLLLPVIVFAQTQTTQSASASVNLIVPLSITAMEGNLDFGEIILTGTDFRQTIEPDQGKRFLVAGHPDRRITILYNAVELIRQPQLSTAQTESTPLLFNPVVQLSDGKEIKSGINLILAEKNRLGELEVFIGGSIDISSDQTHGDYLGTFTLTVTY